MPHKHMQQDVSLMHVECTNSGDVLLEARACHARLQREPSVCIHPCGGCLYTHTPNVVEIVTRTIDVDSFSPDCGCT